MIYTCDVHLGGLGLLDTKSRESAPTDQAELANFAEEATICLIEQELYGFGPRPGLSHDCIAPAIASFTY